MNEHLIENIVKRAFLSWHASVGDFVVAFHDGPYGK
jgi:hypothetical protein